MIKSLIRKFTKKADDQPSAEVDEQSHEAAPAAPKEHAALDLIVIPRTAMEAYPDNPDLIVNAVLDYVNDLTSKARFNRLEIPAEAIQAFHCDYYLAQVNNGGHAQFVANTGANLAFTIADVLSGLKAMGAMAHLRLAHEMAAWVEAHPEDVAAQTGFEGGIAPELAALDDPFYQVEADTPLRPMIAGWIAEAEITQPIDDAMMPRVMSGIALLNPKKDSRDTAINILSMDAMMADPLRVGLGMAGSNAEEVEPVIRIGNGRMMDVNGASEMTFFVQTVKGKRWGTVSHQGAVLYAYIDTPDAAPDKPLVEMTMDDIRNTQPPQIGEIVGQVPLAQIEAAATMCSKLGAAAALDLMLRALPDHSAVDFISVRSAGPDPVGVIGVSLMLVCDRATKAYSAVVDEHGARLLSEPDHTVVTTVTRDQIDMHGLTNQLDEAA